MTQRKSSTDRVPQIIEHEKKADEHEALASKLRWQAAELISAELADGKSQRQLATEVGKSQPHISYMARVWAMFGDNHGYRSEHSFDEAYQAAKRAKPQDDSPAEDNPQDEPQTDADGLDDEPAQEEPQDDSTPAEWLSREFEMTQRKNKISDTYNQLISFTAGPERRYVTALHKKLETSPVTGKLSLILADLLSAHAEMLRFNSQE